MKDWRKLCKNYTFLSFLSGQKRTEVIHVHTSKTNHDTKYSALALARDVHVCYLEGYIKYYPGSEPERGLSTIYIFSENHYICLVMMCCGGKQGNRLK